MASRILLAAVAAAGLVSAGSSNTVRLIANVKKYDLTPSLQDTEIRAIGNVCSAELSFAAAGEQGSVFTSSSLGLVWAENPIASSVVVAPGGTATVPSANVVRALCDKGASTVDIDANTGAVTFQGGVWQACPAHVLNKAGDVVYLSYKSAGQRTLFGCAEVELISVCDPYASAPTFPGYKETTCHI